MDPYKLLSRSSRLSKASYQPKEKPNRTPSGGPSRHARLFGEKDGVEAPSLNQTRKRKRGDDDNSNLQKEEATLDYFASQKSAYDRPNARAVVANGESKTTTGQHSSDDEDSWVAVTLSLEERKKALKEHKVKITWLNPPCRTEKRRRKDQAVGSKKTKTTISLFPQPLRSFRDLRSRYDVSNVLLSNILEQGYITPTEVQLGALPLLLGGDQTFAEAETNESLSVNPQHDLDLLTVAPTGSGKTLAFLVPVLHDIQHRRRQAESDDHRRTSVLILAPTKELTAQIVNEGRKLAKGTGVKISQLRKGMRLADDVRLAENAAQVSEACQAAVIKTDIVVSTPGALQSAIGEAKSSTSSIQHLILDEADVLLDPLFREQTLEIWNSLTHEDLRVTLWSATMGSNIEELARSTMSNRRKQLSIGTLQDTNEVPHIRLVVGLKDSAVPNVQHKLIYAASEQGKLMGLRQLLHPTTSSTDSGPPLRPPFLVFTQTIERAVALHSELLYDIPAEAGGISRIAVLHSDLSDAARDGVMSRFRKSEIWVLITTDLLSRGVDFRGVNGVVNYDLPSSSAAYVHRVGRTGRAGREGGIAVTLYSKEDIPYLKHVANVVSAAQKQNGETSSTQQWLLDALPKLSKNEKQNLKKHGVESRTARGMQKDAKAARKTRISTKAGFVRQTENKRKGAIMGSRRRQQADSPSDAGDESEFAGFD